MGGVAAGEVHRRLEELRAQKKLLQGEIERLERVQLQQDGLDEAVREMLGYPDEYESVMKRSFRQPSPHVGASLRDAESGLGETGPRESGMSQCSQPVALRGTSLRKMVRHVPAGPSACTVKTTPWQK